MTACAKRNTSDARFVAGAPATGSLGLEAPGGYGRPYSSLGLVRYDHRRPATGQPPEVPGVEGEQRLHPGRTRAGGADRVVPLAAEALPTAQLQLARVADPEAAGDRVPFCSMNRSDGLLDRLWTRWPAG